VAACGEAKYDKTDGYAVLSYVRHDEGKYEEALGIARRFWR